MAAEFTKFGCAKEILAAKVVGCSERRGPVRDFRGPSLRIGFSSAPRSLCNCCYPIRPPVGSRGSVGRLSWWRPSSHRHYRRADKVTNT